MPISSGANGTPNAYKTLPRGQPFGPPPKADPSPQENPTPRYSRRSDPPPQQPPGRQPPPHSSSPSGPCCCHCGGSPIYTTGVAGAGAGCFGGGMFGSRKYPFSGDQEYLLQNTGRHRCCACVWGLIIGLLLLALILGLVLGLDPYLRNRRNRNQVQQDYPNGQMVDNIYYFPVTDPPDVYYLVIGPGYPCNPNNNNSNFGPVTVGYDYVSASTTDMIPFTDPERLPDCNSITTAIVLATNITTPTPTGVTTPIPVVTTSGADHVIPMTSYIMSFLLPYMLRWL